MLLCNHLEDCTIESQGKQEATHKTKSHTGTKLTQNQTEMLAQSIAKLTQYAGTRSDSSDISSYAQYSIKAQKSEQATQHTSTRERNDAHYADLVYCNHSHCSLNNLLFWVEWPQ